MVYFQVFKHHGGYSFSTPLLMPKTKFYEGIESCVNLMTHFGSIVALPHDLRYDFFKKTLFLCRTLYNIFKFRLVCSAILIYRVPFARYVAWNGLTLFRRYSIGRVYREKKVFGLQPRGLFECAFDIVTPTPGKVVSRLKYVCFTQNYNITNKIFMTSQQQEEFVKILPNTTYIYMHCIKCPVPVTLFSITTVSIPSRSSISELTIVCLTTFILYRNMGHSLESAVN